MSESNNEKNGLHVNVDPAAGGRYAGPGWIPVPDEGVPPDLLPELKNWLGRQGNRPGRGYDYGMYQVTDLTWDAVRVAVVAARQEKIDRQERRLAEWRTAAQRFLAGEDLGFGFTLDPRKLSQEDRFEPSEEEIALVAAEKRRRDAAAQAEAQVAATVKAMKAAQWLAEFTAAMNEFEAGQCAFARVELLARDSITTPGLQDAMQRFQALRTRVEAEAAAKIAAQKEAFLLGVEAWIKDNGSGRLKLAVQLGQLECTLGVYYDERLHVECGPGWNFYPTSVDIKTRINPTCEELSALATQRKIDESASLGYVRLQAHTDECDQWCEDSDHKYQPALLSQTAFLAWSEKQKTVRKCIIRFF